MCFKKAPLGDKQWEQDKEIWASLKPPFDWISTFLKYSNVFWFLLLIIIFMFWERPCLIEVTSTGKSFLF